MALTILACMLIAAVVGAGVLNSVRRSPLPPAIQTQVHFPVFLPSSAVVLDTKSYKYDQAPGVLSFTGTLLDGQVVTFTEQTTPDPFNDIPNYTTQFLQTLFEYHSFDSLQGTVYLTHPSGAGQAAVMISKGTLLFARVAHDEPASVWETIFNHLTIYT